MQLRFHLSGSLLFSTEADAIPPIGSKAIITTESYKKGLPAGSTIEIEIGKYDPPEIEYNSDGSIVAHISLNGYEILIEGPKPPE